MRARIDVNVLVALFDPDPDHATFDRSIPLGAVVGATDEHRALVPA